MQRHFSAEDNLYKQLICFISMVNKKGAAHIEMITAFVLFFTFVFFLLLILKPYETTSISGAFVSGVHDSFEREVQTNLTQVFLMADITGNVPEVDNCFYVIFPQNIFAYDLDMSQSLVTDLAGGPFPSEINSGELNIEDITNTQFYKVALSPEFPSDSASGCVELTDYVLGSIVEREVISYTGLMEMKDQYFNDYEYLKDELRIPSVYDFSILVDGIDNADMETLVPLEGEIIANEYIGEVLYPNGTIVNAGFIIRVW